MQQATPLPCEGDIVKIRKYGVEGVVVDCLPNLYEAEAKAYIGDLTEWFKSQTPRLHPSLIAKPWACVAVYPEGSIVVPVSDVVIVEVFAKWFGKRLANRSKNRRKH